MDLNKPQNTSDKSGRVFSILAIALGVPAVMISGLSPVSLFGISGILLGALSLSFFKKAKDFCVVGFAVSSMSLVLNLVLININFFQEGAPKTATASIVNDSTTADQSYGSDSSLILAEDSSYSNDDTSYPSDIMSPLALPEEDTEETTGEISAEPTQAKEEPEAAEPEVTVKTTDELDKEGLDLVLGNISVGSYLMPDGTYCSVAVNNSDYIITNLRICLNFKDSEGEVLSTGTDDHMMVFPNQTVISKFESPESFSKYNTTAEISSCDKQPTNAPDSIDYKISNDDNSIGITLSNESSNDLCDIKYVLLYYTGDELIDASDIMDLESLKAGEESVNYLPTSETDYDNAKVIINQAILK